MQLSPLSPEIKLACLGCRKEPKAAEFCRQPEIFTENQLGATHPLGAALFSEVRGGVGRMKSVPLIKLLMLSCAFVRAGFEIGVTARGVFACACQYIVPPRTRTGNRTLTQMRHHLLVKGRAKCARQLLASTLSALVVAAT